MSYKVLYRKYRPDNFDNVVGQDYTINMLKNSITNNKNAHAYIFTGPRGTGKTSTAKIFAKALNCQSPQKSNPCNKCQSCTNFNENPDIIEIDAASNNGVDEIRELINNVKLVPSTSKYKVYIIDEVHMLSSSAFNALLLTLEEPPSHVIFILATTDIQNVPITILSRCQRFDFKPIDKETITKRLEYICQKEKINATSEALSEIATISNGGMRDSLGMLDQLSSSNEKITINTVSEYFGSISIKKIKELIKEFETNNISQVIKIINEIKKTGTNYTVLIEKVITQLKEIAIEIKESKGNHQIYFETIYDLVFDLNQLLVNISLNIDPYSLIELQFLKYMGNKENNFPGNIQQEEILKDNEKKQIISQEIIHNEQKSKVFPEKTKININTRINNCFVECTKEQKNKMVKELVEFMNYLMGIDRNIISLLADTDVLAASEKYIIISSKIESTNNLINLEIDNIEEKYKDFSGNNVKFVAISNQMWKKEVEKYRFNLKNKIKYTYMEENIKNEEPIEEKNNTDTIEELAKDIFGTFEIK